MSETPDKFEPVHSPQSDGRKEIHYLELARSWLHLAWSAAQASESVFFIKLGWSVTEEHTQSNMTN